MTEREQLERALATYRAELDEVVAAKRKVREELERITDTPELNAIRERAKSVRTAEEQAALTAEFVGAAPERYRELLVEHDRLVHRESDLRFHRVELVRFKLDSLEAVPQAWSAK